MMQTMTTTTATLEAFRTSGSDRDRDALLRALVAAEGRAVRRLCRTHERDPSRQEELEQDVWVAVWRALPQFRGDASLRTFVFRVAHNVAARHVSVAVRQVDEASERVAEPTAETTDPGQRMDRRRQRAELERAVAALPLVDRQLVSSWLEGMSTAEIAAIAGMTVTNTTTRLSRARRRLMASLGRTT